MAEIKATKEIPQILKPEQAAQMQPAPLPPPGYEREEVLKQRTDNLQAAIDKAPEAYSIDDDVFDVDRELRAMLEHNVLEVSNPKSGYRYGWFYTGHHGTELMFKKAQGWETVQGNDLEADELRGVDTTRRFGDCLLMRIPERLYRRLELRQQLITQRKMGAGDEHLRGIVDEYRRRHHPGVEVKINDPGIIQRFGGDSPAQQTVMGTVDRMLRSGTVPGLNPSEL